MKKLSFIISLLLFVSNLMANTITVDDVTIPQGGQANLTIRYQFDAADIFSGYQFTLMLPTGVKTSLSGTQIVYTKGNCYTNTHTISTNYVQDSGENIIVCLSTGNEPLIGVNDILLSVSVEADKSLNVGSTVVGTLQEVKLGKIDGTKDIIENVEFEITIGEPVDSRIILDETSTTAPENATGVDVRVKRTINANEWSTLCLPFAMSEAQVKTAFGEDVQLADFTGCETEMDGEENVVGIRVNFVAVSAIEANHPYLIKVSEAVSEWTVDGVDVEPDEASVDCDRIGSGTKRDPYLWNSFVGTYVAGTEVPAQTLFLNGNQFWYSTGATTMKAFHGYFDFYDVLAEVESAGAKVRIAVSGGEATGVKGVGGETADRTVGVYTLQGVKVGETEADVKSLPRGAYIMNGKKVVKK